MLNKLKEITVFTTQDDEGNEVIVSGEVKTILRNGKVGMTMLPLVSISDFSLKVFLKSAEEEARELKSYRIIKFTRAEDVTEEVKKKYKK